MATTPATVRQSTETIAVSELRRQLAAIDTPWDALDVADIAARVREAYKLMNRSVEECNEVAEIYLLATWKFGDLVSDISAGGNGSNQHAKR